MNGELWKTTVAVQFYHNSIYYTRRVALYILAK